MAVRLADRTIGVQVTEIDPYVMPGSARGQEKAVAKAASGGPYCMPVQTDPPVVLDAIAKAIERKVDIAAKHPFDGYDEVWLLLCGGLPDAVVSTFLMTPWFSAADLNLATDHLLQKSKYGRCFLFPIVGLEQAFYLWDRASRCEKRVRIEDISHVPREAYVDSLRKAAEAGNWQEVDRLCDEEARKVLAELRQAELPIA